MASEEWKIILEESATTTAGGPAGGAADGAGAGTTAPILKSKTWQDVGKIAGTIAGVAGPLAFIIQAVRRSKVFSTFMDNLLTIFGAVVDMLLIPMIPFFMTFLKLSTSFLPLALQIGKAMGPIFNSLAEALGVLLKTGDLGPIIQWFDDLFNKYLIPWLTNFFAQTGPKIIEFLGNVLPKIVTFLGTILPLVMNFLGQVIQIILPNLVTLWNLLVPKIVEFLNTYIFPLMSQMINAFMDYFGKGMGSILSWLGENVGRIINNSLPDWLRMPGVWKEQQLTQFKVPEFKLNLSINNQKVATAPVSQIGNDINVQLEDFYFSF